VLEGKIAEAQECLDRALAVEDKLAGDFPSVHRYQEVIAWVQHARGKLFQATGRPRDAERAFRQALATQEKLLGSPQRGPRLPHPGCPRDIARICTSLGELMLDAGRGAEAKEAFLRAVAIGEKLITDYPAVASYRCDLAWLLATCPDTEIRDPPRAVALASQATELAPEFGGAWNAVGVAQCRAGNARAALAALERSIALHGDGGQCRDWFFLAMAHWRRGEKDLAHQWYDRGDEWMERHQPQSAELRRFQAEAAALLSRRPQ
jgi:tetratricopeptide (TPR) repeat protein